MIGNELSRSRLRWPWYEIEEKCVSAPVKSYSALNLLPCFVFLRNGQTNRHRSMHSSVHNAHIYTLRRIYCNTTKLTGHVTASFVATTVGIYTVVPYVVFLSVADYKWGVAQFVLNVMCHFVQKSVNSVVLSAWIALRWFVAYSNGGEVKHQCATRVLHTWVVS